MRSLELQGHWASGNPYTLYSLRSSFVDDKLMLDTPIAVLSMMTGHDQKILMKHYSRLDVLRKSRDLTKLPIGIAKDFRASSRYAIAVLLLEQLSKCVVEIDFMTVGLTLESHQKEKAHYLAT